MYIFNICENSLRTIKGIEHIHPRKQRDIAKVLQQIRPIRVFGSSTRPDCNCTSDIDFLLDSNKIGLSKDKIYSVLKCTVSCPYDVLWIDEVANKLSNIQVNNIINESVELC